jgi:hypothetical protein
MKIKLKSVIIVLAISLFTLVYSFLRYSVFDTFEPPNIALFIGNKVLIFTAIALIPFYIKTKDNTFKLTLNVFIILHIISSLYLLRPAVFPDLFNDSAMINTHGNIIVLLGILAAVFFFNSITKKFIEISPTLNSSILFIFVIAHNISIGWSGWFNYQEWNGGMPPISLLTTLIVIYSLIITTLTIFRRERP